MPSKSTTSPKTRKEVHVCNKEELLDRINLMLVGNGHPEDGLVFKVRLFVENQEEIKKSIGEINGTVKQALVAASKASKALDIYKAETVNYSAGKQAARDLLDKRSSSKWMKAFQTIMILIAALGLSLTTYFSVVNLKTSESTLNRVDDLGVPIVTRSGQIKFFPKDFMNDTIPEVNVREE